MASITVPVASPVGLHARPAALIAQAAAASSQPVTLQVADSECVDAASVMMVMTLDAAQGTPVTVHCDDESTAQQIAELISKTE